LGHAAGRSGFCVHPWHSAAPPHGRAYGDSWQGLGERRIPTQEEFVAEYNRYSELKPLLPVSISLLLVQVAVISSAIATAPDTGTHGPAGSSDLDSLADALRDGRFDIPEWAK